MLGNPRFLLLLPLPCVSLQQDGSVAQTKIKLRHGDTLIVNTLVGTVQLNALRRFLAEGFQVHLQQNPLLHQIFSFEPREERPERLTPLEKKMYRRVTSCLAYCMVKSTGTQARRVAFRALLYRSMQVAAVGPYASCHLPLGSKVTV